VIDLKELLDGLDAITKSLSLLDRQNELISIEVESVQDLPSLEMLTNAANDQVSDSASRKLRMIEASSVKTASAAVAGLGQRLLPQRACQTVFLKTRESSKPYARDWNIQADLWRRTRFPKYSFHKIRHILWVTL
jgi:hypothetical protein